MNCGFERPALKFQDGKFNFKRFGLLSTALFIIALVFALFYSSTGEFKAEYIFISLVLSFILSFFVNILLKIFEDEKVFEKRNSANKNNLIEKGRIIQERISELANRGQKIDAVLDKIEDTDSPKLQEVRAKLLSAREIVVSQFALYELQARKIELVRIQNDVSPYLFGLHRLNEKETEQCLLTIETTKRVIERMRQNLTRYDAIDFNERVLPDKENFLSQLSETNNSCEKLREAILSRQAAHALHGISPVEESLKLPASKDLVHAADTFNIQTTLTDFSESFEALEQEYRRLKAESEIKITES